MEETGWFCPETRGHRGEERRFQDRRLGGAGTWQFPFGAQQVRKAQQIVGEHGGADEKFEALSALGQTALHATPSEQHRDAALDAGPEALSFFEGRTFLD